MKIDLYSASRYICLLVVLFVSTRLFACKNTKNNVLPITAVITKNVTPFNGMNSVYDDFNSGPGFSTNGYFSFYFSSNRDTQGGTFDIVSMYVYEYYNPGPDGDLSMDVSPAPTNLVWPGTNTPSNEYGPTVVYLPDGRTVYLYASDVTGNLDIYYVVEPGGVVKSANVLNSAYDDAYPTRGLDHAIYFTSNRGGVFDIYRAEIPTGADLPTWLESSGPANITKVDVLNSTSNDKCPYIHGKFLVFTSDRSGGYGGYDLYYSIYGTAGWSAPVNFGPSINTAHDEYRPVVKGEIGYVNDLMIFSSNRPGGMGGFDLYYVGIQKSPL